MTQRVLEYAIVFRTGTVRCHRDDWHHRSIDAVDVVDVMIVDENIVICRVSGWSGYRDCIVVDAVNVNGGRRMVKVAIGGATAATATARLLLRSIGISVMLAARTRHEMVILLFDVDSGDKVILDIWCRR